MNKGPMSKRTTHRNRPQHLRRTLALAVALALAAPGGDAWALFRDQLELFAQERITYDDNVFRIPRGVDPHPITGSQSTSDVYTTTSLGANLNVPWSRQAFHAGWAWNIVRFNKFDDIDLTGHEGHALWDWRLGNDLNGTLGYTDLKAQAAFAGIGARVFDPVTTRTAYGTAAYNITPSWRLSTGGTDTQVRNQVDTRKVNDANIRTANVGFAYVTAAGNQLGVITSREEGEYPNRTFIPGFSIIDNSYHRRGAGVFTEWGLTGQSHLSARVERIRMEFDHVPQRNFDATVGRVAHDWLYSANLTLSTILRRDVAPVEDLASSIALIRGLTFNPTYRLTEKTSLVGTYDYSRRTYLADPGLTSSDPLVVSVRPAGSQDRLWIASASLAYRYSRNLSFLTTYSHEDRTATYNFGNYKANVVFVQARVGI
jgi:exopolysaccharide biosynthesis operon protein EpsL